VLCSQEDFAESTEPAPACCLGIEMAGEQSWIEFNSTGRKTPPVAQPFQIITENEPVHIRLDDEFNNPGRSIFNCSINLRRSAKRIFIQISGHQLVTAHPALAPVIGASRSGIRRCNAAAP
jgi:hypothetical protein